MTFEVDFQFDSLKIVWKISFLADKTNNQLMLRSEQVLQDGKTLLLDYLNGKGYRMRIHPRTGKIDREPIMSGAYPCSQLKFLDNRTAGRYYPKLFQIKQFFEKTIPLDLLTPHNMRKTVRGKERTLGIRGEKLPALIQQMSPEERDILMSRIRKALPNMTRVDSIMGRAGWTHLETMEDYGSRHLKVPTSGISDGTLRLMALFSLSFLQKQNGMTLLDEVEDGINSANVELFLKSLKQYIEENRQQVLLTTHSTVVLDYVEPECIRYLYRDENGFTRCKEFLELENVKSQLDFLYPGEILLNTSPEDLLGKQG